MSDRPAWITAWERGFAAGSAARAEGRTAMTAADIERAGSPSAAYGAGFADGLDPDRVVDAGAAPIAIALVETIVGAFAVSGSRRRQLLGFAVVWVALDPAGPVVSRWRRRSPRARADVPPAGVMNVGLKMGWMWGRRRAFGSVPDPWTTIGMTLPLVFESEQRGRRDAAAWRAYWSSRAA